MFATVYDTVYELASGGVEAASGALFWLLAGESSTPDYDGYTVYPSDVSTAAIIEDQVQRMAAISAA